MPRFSNILCPVDFDQGSLAAVPVAADLAREHKATLYLLHVVAIPLAAEPALPSGEAETAAETRLERIGHQKLKAGTHYEILVMTGDPAGEILQMAARLDIDLIVMATHGRKGLRRLVLGSDGRTCGSGSRMPGAHGQTEGRPCWSISDAAPPVSRAGRSCWPRPPSEQGRFRNWAVSILDLERPYHAPEA